MVSVMKEHLSPSQKSGALAEEAAARYLSAMGMRVLARNFRTRCGEIDIVALDGDTLVFVEVKYRKVSGFGAPHEFVTRRKIERMKKAAWTYIERHKLFDAYMRFDVVSVKPSGIKHFENAFA